ncbi:MAG: hypothetical protein K0U52_02345 [Gammaproteobacteria bacterium]|jgi:hypothetical protein|nr:hypothetical protein [Gammaproteobacteria bacterium]
MQEQIDQYRRRQAQSHAEGKMSRDGPLESKEEKECPICWTKDPPFFSLCCGHQVCNACYEKMRAFVERDNYNPNLRNCPLCREPIKSYKDILIPPNPTSTPWRRRTRAQRRGPRLVRNRRRNIPVPSRDPVPWRSGQLQRSPVAPVRNAAPGRSVFAIQHSPVNDREKQRHRARRASGYHRHQRSRYSTF